MSALLQTPNPFSLLRRISEEEAIQALSKTASTACDIASGLESLAGIALRLPGMHGIEMNLRGEVLEWYKTQKPAPLGSAHAIIAANGEEWGRLRLLFEPRIQSVECPLHFSRFIAQQTALMLQRIETETENGMLALRRNRLQRRLETRKAVHRASGLLAAEENISLNDALQDLMRRSRTTRKPLFAVAQAVILRATPTLRRLAPHELTS